MKLGLPILFSLLTCTFPKAFAEDFLDMVCKDDARKDHCMILFRGFLTGYAMGYHNGTHNALAASNEKGPELCVPAELTNNDIYEDMHQHLPDFPDELAMLDMSLFVAALRAYPCENMDD